VSEPTAEDRHAALVERVAKCIASWAGCEDCGTSASYTSEAAEKVLDLIEAEVERLRADLANAAEVHELQMSLAADRVNEAEQNAADADRESERLRMLLAETLDGWAFAAYTLHRACCLDRHGPEHCRGPRIAEIRREAGL